MARAEARILVSIWADEDFRALSPTAQWAYMFLLSQPDLTHTGIIPLRVRRWSSNAAGMTVAILAEALRELERSRFIVADRDTEELLIRTFIRGDQVYRQPNLLRAARKGLSSIASVKLRAALAAEVERCVPIAEASSVALLEAMLEDLAKGTPIPSTNPSPMGSEMAPAIPLGDRGVVTAVTTGFPSPLNPSPLTPVPSPPPLASLAADASPSARQLVAEWIDRCKKRPPERTVGAVAKHVKALLEDGSDPDDIRSALDAWRLKGADPSALHGFVNAAANAEPRGSPGRRPSTTDQRVSDNLALVAEFETKEITA